MNHDGSGPINTPVRVAAGIVGACFLVGGIALMVAAITELPSGWSLCLREAVRCFLEPRLFERQLVDGAQRGPTEIGARAA